VSVAATISVTSIYYAGGGAGGLTGTTGSAGTGGLGGGGAGSKSGANPVGGATNTGGGGGGGGAAASAGGSGVVILSVPTTVYSGVTTGSPTVTTVGSNTVLKYTTGGSYTA